MVDARLATGMYDGAEQVLAAALGTLAYQDSDDLRQIRAGLADVDAGRTRPVEVAEAEFRARYGLDVAS
jgi:predicted transcriptional regulator